MESISFVWDSIDKLGLPKARIGNTVTVGLDCACSRLLGGDTKMHVGKREI